MTPPRLPRRQALVDELNDDGWRIVARGGLRIATRGRISVRVNGVTGEVNLHGHGWTASFDRDVPDFVIVAAASANELPTAAPGEVEPVHQAQASTVAA